MSLTPDDVKCSVRPDAARCRRSSLSAGPQIVATLWRYVSKGAPPVGINFRWAGPAPTTGTNFLMGTAPGTQGQAQPFASVTLPYVTCTLEGCTGHMQVMLSVGCALLACCTNNDGGGHAARTITTTILSKDERMLYAQFRAVCGMPKRSLDDAPLPAPKASSPPPPALPSVLAVASRVVSIAACIELRAALDFLAAQGDAVTPETAIIVLVAKMGAGFLSVGQMRLICAATPRSTPAVAAVLSALPVYVLDTWNLPNGAHADGTLAAWEEKRLAARLAALGAIAHQ